MNWDNTKTKYQDLIKEHPLLAKRFAELILCVLMDCRNKMSDGFADLEVQIKDLGRKDTED